MYMSWAVMVVIHREEAANNSKYPRTIVLYDVRFIKNQSDMVCLLFYGYMQSVYVRWITVHTVQNGYDDDDDDDVVVVATKHKGSTNKMGKDNNKTPSNDKSDSKRRIK